MSERKNQKIPFNVKEHVLTLKQIVKANNLYLQIGTETKKCNVLFVAEHDSKGIPNLIAVSFTTKDKILKRIDLHLTMDNLYKGVLREKNSQFGKTATLWERI